MKRALDIVGGLMGLVLIAPVALLGVVLVWTTMGRPVWFGAWRLGREGRPFRMWKLRTMRAVADRGAPVTVAGDPRITTVGRWVRACHLDEWPQFWHVVRGDMSLVGPRPEDPQFLPDYTEAQRVLLRHRPGMTSPATLACVDEASRLTQADPVDYYRRVLLPAKLAMDLAYCDRATVWSDLGVLWQTARHVLRGGRARHASHPRHQ